LPTFFFHLLELYILLFEEACQLSDNRFGYILVGSCTVRNWPSTTKPSTSLFVALPLSNFFWEIGSLLLICLVTSTRGNTKWIPSNAVLPCAAIKWRLCSQLLQE
jgi:hypothetical protein